MSFFPQQRDASVYVRLNVQSFDATAASFAAPIDEQVISVQRDMTVKQVKDYLCRNVLKFYHPSQQVTLFEFDKNKRAIRAIDEENQENKPISGFLTSKSSDKQTELDTVKWTANTWLVILNIVILSEATNNKIIGFQPIKSLTATVQLQLY
jgi:hypothetical protein